MAVAVRGAKGRPKHIPQRTCVGCRCTTAKRGLVRVVRTPAGTVKVDPTGKEAGRGAYLCPREACWRQAFMRKRLDHALRAAVSEADKQGLLEYVASHHVLWSTSIVPGQSG